MKSLIRVVILLALAPLLTAATVVQAPQCPDGRFYAAGFCPPNLTSASESNVADTTAQVVLSTTRDSGTLYCAVSTSATPPLKSEIKAGTGGSIVAAATPDNVNASGQRTLAFSGLTPATTYYTYCVHEWQGRDSFVANTGSWLTTGGAAGTNAARISAILNGRSPHFAYSMPADPVTTREVTVTSATQFNTEAATAGTKININVSFAGNIQIAADDVDVVMSNDATITGNLTLGPSGYVNRIRWTGGNVLGRFIGPSYRDALFDDVYFHINTGPDYFHYIAMGNRIDRFAFLNSTFRVSGTSGSGDNWAFFILQRSAADPHSDLLFLNSKSLSTGLHAHRVQTVANQLYVDSAFNPDGTVSGAGLRIHLASEDVWIKDSWVRGNFHINEVSGSDGVAQVINALFDNLDRYAPDAAYAFTAPLTVNNSGEVRNSRLHSALGVGDGTFTIGGGMVTGTGNDRVAWDGNAVPDYTVIGAQRAPYTIQGIVPEGWHQYINWPEPPRTTTLVSGTAADTTAEIQAAIDAGQREIVVPDGTYGSLNFGVASADIYLRAQNAGAVNFTSLTVHGTRIRIDGIRVEQTTTAAVDMIWGPQDILFDNVYLSTSAQGAPTVWPGGSENVNSRGDFVRIAFINSTIQHLATQGPDSWPLLMANDPGINDHNRDLIFANCYIRLGPDADVQSKHNRVRKLDNYIIVDSYLEAPSRASNQFRVHNGTINTLLSNNIIVEGSTQMYFADNGDGTTPFEPVDNFYIIGNRYYETFNVDTQGPFTAMAQGPAEATNGYAELNDHYSAAQTSGTSTMDIGQATWNLYQNNVRRVYQAPPTRTQGASH